MLYCIPQPEDVPSFLKLVDVNQETESMAINERTCYLCLNISTEFGFFSFFKQILFFFRTICPLKLHTKHLLEASTCPFS